MSPQNATIRVRQLALMLGMCVLCAGQVSGTHPLLLHPQLPSSVHRAPPGPLCSPPPAEFPISTLESALLVTVPTLCVMSSQARKLLSEVLVSISRTPEVHLAWLLPAVPFLQHSRLQSNRSQAPSSSPLLPSCRI